MRCRRSGCTHAIDRRLGAEDADLVAELQQRRRVDDFDLERPAPHRQRRPDAEPCQGVGELASELLGFGAVVDQHTVEKQFA